MVNSIGFGDVWYNQGVIDQIGFVCVIKQRLFDMFKQSWSARLVESPRTRFYRQVVDQHMFHKLLDIIRCKNRIALTRLIGKTPVRIILWGPITKKLIKACFLIQPLEQEGVYQKCCVSLCSKVFINHFYQLKASPECLNILTYWSKYWVDRLRRILRGKV